MGPPPNFLNSSHLPTPYHPNLQLLRSLPGHSTPPSLWPAPLSAISPGQTATPLLQPAAGGGGASMQ